MKIRANLIHGKIVVSLIGGGLFAVAGCASNTTGQHASCTPRSCGRECHVSAPATTTTAQSQAPVAAPATTTTAQSQAPVAAPATTTTAQSQASVAAPATQSAAQVGQRTFASADAAADALKEAVTAGDRQALLAILGPEGQQLVFSGDPVEEANGMKKFAGHLTEYLRIDPETSTKSVLYIGLKNWPFPIPVVKSDKGWVFDTAAGKEELLDRRIGANELNAIAVCRAFVVAQKAYAQLDPMGAKGVQYARHFRSSEGKRDGLYWPVVPGEQISPMGPLLAEAQSEGYLKDPKTGKHEPYKGYFFHTLTAQGDAAPGGKMDYMVDGNLVKGFAMVAWPDAWGDSGVMTFIVNQDGKIYQKNLGEKTAEVVKEVTEYNPDSSWTEVKD